MALADESMSRLLSALVKDDLARVRELLKADCSLAVQEVKEAKLYQSQIFHWLYARDTALHLAAAGHREGTARLLLDAGADVNAAANHRRGTPLHYAADGCVTGTAWEASRQVSTIKLLLENGAAIHAADKNGATPLHRAVRTRCAAAVRCLIEAGADPTGKNGSGSTAFHLAVQSTGRGGSGAEVAIAAQRQIIEEFLSIGVSPLLKDGKGKSVVEWARSGWVREMVAGNA